MSRCLTLFNLVGVVSLSCVCVLQWQVNRQLNLQRFEGVKARQELMARMEEQAGRARDCQADRDRFRDQLARLSAAGKETGDALATLRRECAVWRSERDSLKSNVVAWAEGVAARDRRIEEAARAMENLARERDERIHAFNRLASNHNTTVKRLEEAVRLTERSRTNRPASPPGSFRPTEP